MRGLYGVFDSKSGTIIGMMFFSAAPAAAIRDFKDSVTDPKSQMARHPEDFDLYCYGHTVPDEARVEWFVAPSLTCTGATFAPEVQS